MNYRLNKRIFLGITALVGIVGLLSSFSIANLGWLIGFLALAYVIVVVDPLKIDTVQNARVSATSYLPLYFFAVFASMIVARWQPIWANMNAENLGLYAGNYEHNMGFVILIILGAAAILFAIAGENSSWLYGIGVPLLGAALVGVRWVDIDTETWFIPGGRSVFVVYALCAFAIGVAHMLAEVSIVGENKKLRLLNRWVTGLNIGILTLINIVCSGPYEGPEEAFGAGNPFGYVGVASSEAFNSLITLPDTWMAWWKVILVFLVLTGITGILGPDDIVTEGKMPLGSDVLVVIMAANNLLITRFLFANWFTHSWIFMAILISLEIWVVAKYSGHPARVVPNGVTLMTVYLILAIVSIIAIHKGLLLNVVVTLVGLAVFWLVKGSKNGRNLAIASTILLLAEVAAWQGARRFSVEGLLLLATIAVVAILVFVIIYWKHPAGNENQKLPRRRASIIVIAGVAILGLLALPTTEKITEKVDGTSVVIAVKAKGKGNKISSIHYSWRDRLGHEVEGGDLDPGAIALPIRNDILIVTVKDTRGFTATRTYFYPDWKFERAPVEEPAEPPAEEG